MTTFKWAVPASIATALDSGLNSLASGSLAISTAIDNETDLYELINLEFILASVDWSAATGLEIDIWFLTTVDGSNYEDGGTSVTPARPPDVIIPVRQLNGAQRIHVNNIPIPPLEFKILLKNGSSAAMAASSNYLKYRRHNEQAV